MKKWTLKRLFSKKTQQLLIRIRSIFLRLEDFKTIFRQRLQTYIDAKDTFEEMWDYLRRKFKYERQELVLIKEWIVLLTKNFFNGSNYEIFKIEFIRNQDKIYRNVLENLSRYLQNKFDKTLLVIKIWSAVFYFDVILTILWAKIATFLQKLSG